MRHAKQLIYGILYLTFWVAVGSGFYFHYLKPAPSCFDNTQNQGEEGIDCGPVCGNECMSDLQPLRANNVWVLPIVVASNEVATSSAFISTSTQISTRASLLAEVRNPNPGYAVSGFNYTFILYDDAGAAIASVPGSSYIYASEVKYVAIANVELPVAASKVRSATLAIAQSSWKKAGLLAKPDVVATLTQVDTNGTFSIQGVARNNEAVPLHVDLLAILKDSAGNPKGTSLTSINRLPAGDSRQFAIFHPLMKDIASDRTQLFASSYTTQ